MSVYVSPGLSNPPWGCVTCAEEPTCPQNRGFVTMELSESACLSMGSLKILGPYCQHPSNPTCLVTPVRDFPGVTMTCLGLRPSQ